MSVCVKKHLESARRYGRVGRVKKVNHAGLIYKEAIASLLSTHCKFSPHYSSPQDYYVIDKL